MSSVMTSPRDRVKFYTAGRALASVGQAVIRYGLVIVLVWVGALKFTAYEAENIRPMVANSPLMAWSLQVLSLQTLAGLLGAMEITMGLLIALRLWSAAASAVGSLWAVGMFCITLSFVFTTPGVWEPGYGFPFPSALPGQFLAKDVILLGAAVWSAGEALAAANQDSTEADL